MRDQSVDREKEDRKTKKQRQTMDVFHRESSECMAEFSRPWVSLLRDFNLSLLKHRSALYNCIMLTLSSFLKRTVVHPLVLTVQFSESDKWHLNPLVIWVTQYTKQIYFAQTTCVLKIWHTQTVAVWLCLAHREVCPLPATKSHSRACRITAR